MSSNDFFVVGAVRDVPLILPMQAENAGRSVVETAPATTFWMDEQFQHALDQAMAPSGDGPGSVETQIFPEETASVQMIDDAVEYYWQVGCTPTAIAIVIGYWDRNGYDNLIEGDTTYFSQAVKGAIAGSGHYDNYYEGWDQSAPDASELGGAHDDVSIADFAHTSRSVLGLNDGWSNYGWEGIGVHGYANSRGYDNFQASHSGWGSFSFDDIKAEIDAGRPVILSVDSNADGINDHNVVVFGYNTDTSDLLVHDGWEQTNDMRWISFQPRSAGHEFGITSATFVTPGENLADAGASLYMTLINDGGGTARSEFANPDGSGLFSTDVLTGSSNLSRATLDFATADGHTFYSLLNDYSGSAMLVKAMHNGTGKFNWYTMNANSGLSRDTVALATADGETFYSLEKSGVSYKLYASTMNEFGQFTSTFLQNIGWIGNVKGMSTKDGETFTIITSDNSGTATVREGVLTGSTMTLTTVSTNGGVSNALTGLAEWEGQDQPPEYVGPNAGDDFSDPILSTDLSGGARINGENVLMNDSGQGGSSVTITAVDGVAVTSAGWQGWVDASNGGQIAMNTDGRVQFRDVDGDFAGLLEGEDATTSITYTVTDSNGDTATATVFFLVEGNAPTENVDPDAGDDVSAAILASDLADGAKINGDNVLNNDFDANGDAVEITAIDGVAVSGGGWQGWIDASNGGQIAMNTDGRVQFRDRDGDFATLQTGQQTTTSISYTVSDGNGGTDTATVSFVIDGTAPSGNVDPNANDDVFDPILAADLAGGAKINGDNILTNDADANGDTLEIAAIDGVDVTDDGWQGWRDASNGGQIVINTDGRVQFRDNGFDFAEMEPGEAIDTSLTYTVSDGNGGTDTATVTFTITDGEVLDGLLIDDGDLIA